MKLISADQYASLAKTRYGTYEIWIKEDIAEILLKPLWATIDGYLISRANFEGEVYIGVYYGWSKKLYDTLSVLSKGEYSSKVAATYKFARIVKALVKKSPLLYSVKKVLDNCVVKWYPAYDDFEARANQKAQLNRSDVYWVLNIKGNHRVPAARKILESIVAQ